MRCRWTFILAVGLLAAGTLGAQATYRPFLVEVRPVLDLPIPPDHLLFQPSGGASLGVRYVFPFARQLSVGPALTVHVARMEHRDIASLRSLSLVAGEATTEFRTSFLQPVELWLAVGAGWFYAFLIRDPSQQVTNVVWDLRAGIGIRVSHSTTLDLGAEYRRYESLYHALGIGVGVDVRLPIHSLRSAQQEELAVCGLHEEICVPPRPLNVNCELSRLSEP